MRSRRAITSACLAPGQFLCGADIGQLICDARTEGLRLAIASSSTPQNVAGLLQANLGPKANTWFEVIAAGDIVAAKKAGTGNLSVDVEGARPCRAGDCLAVRRLGAWPGRQHRGWHPDRDHGQ